VTAEPHTDSPGTVSSAGHRGNGIVAGVIALHLAVTTALSWSLNIWLDEAYSLEATSGNLADVLRSCRDFMLYPPLYFVALWFWRILGESAEFGRLLSVVAVGTTLWMVHRASQRWFPRLPSWWVVLPLAFNPFVLFAATELRPYAFVLFWSAALLYLFPGAYLGESRRRTEQVLYILCGAAAIYTHYFSGFVLPGGALALLVWRRWKALRDYLVSMAVCGVLIVPQLLTVRGGSEHLSQGISDVPSLPRALVFVVSRMFGTLLGLFDFSEVVRPMILAGVVLALMVLFAARWRSRSLESTAPAFMAGVVGGCYFLLVWRMLGETVFDKHFIVALLPIHFAIAAVLNLYGRSAWRIPATSFALIAVLGIAASAARFGPLAKVGDYARVAEYIESVEGENEPIFVAVSHCEYPMRYYYSGANPIVPVPRHDDLSAYGIDNWRIIDRDQIDRLLATVPSGGRFWVFTDRPADTTFLGVDLNLHLLEDALEDRATLEDEHTFYHARLRRYQKDGAETGE
jgi:uncharacterized membrane protein